MIQVLYWLFFTSVLLASLGSVYLIAYKKGYDRGFSHGVPTGEMKEKQRINKNDQLSKS